MFGVRPARFGRFSLLLLDEGEYYVKDFVAYCTWPADVEGNWQHAARLPGQLRLCTRSLFFEADDVRVPIVRLPFAHVEQLEGIGGHGMVAEARRWTKMKASAADAPYVFEKGRLTSWRFDLAYAALSDFMPPAQQMLMASRLPPAEQEEVLEAFMRQLEAALRFDAGHLRAGASEAVALELSALCLTPLVREPGRLVVTASRLYLQPLHNITGAAAVRSHPLAAVAAVARRRSSLRDVGMEVFFVQPPEEAGVAGPLWGAPSAFFAFRTAEERERAVAAVMGQAVVGTALPGGRAAAAACGSILEAGGEWLGRVTSAWQRGRLSNFDYLLYCNLAAGRSFNDLTQYPVFPWVLADYTSTELDLTDPATFRDLSRPIGALSPGRLEMFRERFAEMASDPPPGGDPPFLYGTHYSCPGYAMYWLVRAAPAHMLRLQNGRFDSPDRLFCGVRDAWESVLGNPADVKELIPEFFMPGRTDVLRNSHHLALGTRQNGRPVGDVELPPWASASPRRFLELHRSALESPFASANLHHWIDLVFGAKQSGQAAVEADNVFRHLAYEGAVDPESIADPVQRAAVEMAINEFGQCPRQIFRHPHPRRLVCPPPPAAPSAGGMGAAGDAGEVSGQSLSLALVSAIMAAAAVTTGSVQESASVQSAASPPPQIAEAVPVEVPALLDQLDVGRKQPPREVVPVESAAASGLESPTKQPKSPFASGRNGLIGRLGALKDALGEAVASRDAVASAAEGWQPEGSGASEANLSSSRSGSTPQQMPSGSRLSSFAGGLSSKWQSFTASRSSASASSAVAEGAAAAKEAASMAQEGKAPAAVPATGAQAVAQEEHLPWKFASRGAAAARPRAGTSAGEEGGLQPASSSSSGSANLDTLLQAQRRRMLCSRPGSGASLQLGGWGPGLRDRLQAGRVLTAGSEAVNALALAMAHAAPCAYCACHDGSVRIFDLASGEQLRVAKLGPQPLASLALLPGSALSPGAPHPTVLCGSYSSEVLVYSPASGSKTARFTPHTDAVSCLDVAPGGAALVTASWDCSVRAWALGEGRQPWTSTLPQPSAAVADLPGGVWALALGGEGHSALAGTEEGAVVALDLRSPPASALVWEQALSQDYIGGVCFLPGGHHALAARADGALTLLDLRKAGAVLSLVACGSPLRCCASDGSIALAGSEAGGVVFWDAGQQLGRAPPAGTFSPPGLDGLHPPLVAEPALPVNALALESLPSGNGGEARLCLATGHESGALRCYWA